MSENKNSPIFGKFLKNDLELYHENVIETALVLGAVRNDLNRFVIMNFSKQ